MKFRVFYSPAICDINDTARQELLEDLATQYSTDSDEFMKAKKSIVKLCKLHIELFDDLLIEKFGVEYAEPNGRVEEVKE